jgi:ABC-2 type transport system ATP-binding protein
MAGGYQRVMMIELEDLTKTYGAVTALAGLSTALPEGAVGLLGPNGAGKTTMIRSLLGLIAVDSGRGRVLGLDIASEALEIRQAVGFVPEDDCLFPGVTGVQFVAYAGELVGMRPRDALQRAHEVLDYVDLGEARYRRAESYSTGMKQRLKIASAIVHDPRLLILDEPTNGMDPVGRDEILELCRDLSRAKGMNLLISSHLLPDVEAVCEHVVVLGKGRVLAQGRIAELKQAHDRQFELRVRGDQRRFAALLEQRGVRAEPVNDHLLVDLPPGATVAALWGAADAADEQIRALRPRRSTLEEVFLKALEEPS